MMLLLDFAVVVENRSGGKKTHGNHFNNNTDREYLSVSNNNNKKELDQNQESSPLLRWSLIIKKNSIKIKNLHLCWGEA